MPFFALKIPNTYLISIPVFGIGLNTGIPEFGIGIGIPSDIHSYVSFYMHEMSKDC